nr:hypothetical protein GCM10020093_113820 [Planobispora longispora]
MATVYLALDVRLDRTVAVKVMHRSLAEDPAFVRRFIGEAKSVASLSHPNVVQVFDQGTDGDNVYLSMEHVPGRTLRDVLRDRGRLPAREALEVMIPVLAALGAAHQAGMIHRDVKPENVLLTDDGRVKVVDFGLARAAEASNQTRTGMMIGTIGYMSPEQVTAGAADARSDVYSAGIMLFELLTGRQPYEGETPMSVAYRHVHDTVPMPSALLPDCPRCWTRWSPRRPPATPRTARRTPRRCWWPPWRRTGRCPGRAARSRRCRCPPPDRPGARPGRAGRGRGVPNHTLIQPRADLLTGPAADRGAPAGTGRRGFRPNWFLVALVVVMIAAVGVTGWLFSQGSTVPVPELLNKNVTLAADEARRLGFVVEIGEAQHDEKVAKDLVMRVDPAPKTEVEPGSTLVLVASAGPKRVNVPNVVGMDENAAKEKLAAAGLTPDDVKKQASETVPRGQVIRTSPGVGTRSRRTARST